MTDKPILPCKHCGYPGEIFVRVTCKGELRSEGYPWVQCDRPGPPCNIVQRRTRAQAIRDWNKLQKPTTCLNCRGTGMGLQSNERCPSCGGKGVK